MLRVSTIILLLQMSFPASKLSYNVVNKISGAKNVISSCKCSNLTNINKYIYLMLTVLVVLLSLLEHRYLNKINRFSNFTINRKTIESSK